MGTAEVWVMFGGGGIATFNREGREAWPPDLPVCPLLSVSQVSLARTIHVSLLLPAPSLSPGLVTKLLSREITGVAIAL